jgi:hypothetical protein
MADGTESTRSSISTKNNIGKIKAFFFEKSISFMLYFYLVPVGQTNAFVLVERPDGMLPI